MQDRYTNSMEQPGAYIKSVASPMILNMVMSCSSQSTLMDDVLQADMIVGRIFVFWPENGTGIERHNTAIGRSRSLFDGKYICTAN
jgi:hypothetical protein